MRHTMRAARVCGRHGCPTLIEMGSGGYCEAHTFRYPEPPKLSRGYSTAAWRRVRWSHLKRKPTCERCGMQPSRHVHHLDGLGPKGPLGLDARNLQALCPGCHSTVTNHERHHPTPGVPQRSTP